MLQYPIFADDRKLSTTLVLVDVVTIMTLHDSSEIFPGAMPALVSDKLDVFRLYIILLHCRNGVLEKFHVCVAMVLFISFLLIYIIFIGDMGLHKHYKN